MFSARPLRSLARHRTLCGHYWAHNTGPSAVYYNHAIISKQKQNVFRAFHATTRREYLPVFLAAALKGTASMQLAQTVARITLSLAPIFLFKNIHSRKFLRVADKKGEYHGHIITEEMKKHVTQKLRKSTRALQILLFTPVLLFWATIVASLERTPLTGRLRLIILSPDEEDDISSQLAGAKWYQAVEEILADEGSPPVISENDWRYRWVRDTLRRLENVVPILQMERDMEPIWLSCSTDDFPLPPPSPYPLTPRPRGTEYIRNVCDRMYAMPTPPSPHTRLGPPYSLMLVDKPDAANAFSFGFGPDGGGGIVVYSGFIDDIMSKMPTHHPSTPSPPVGERPKSWFSSLFSSLIFSASPSPRGYVEQAPTEEQTAELAILLAHELAHLILSHHLETLSSATVIVPGLISIVTDFVRAMLFPVTMLFGPFVNDAVAQVGKIGSGELIKVGEYCTSMTQEIEADVVSARLLAHAGFDARRAVRFWESRQVSTASAECTSGLAEKMGIPKPGPALSMNQSSPYISQRLVGSGHPVAEARIASLRGELERWQRERERELQKRTIPT